MPSRSFFNALKRHGRAKRFLIIRSFHLLPISVTVVATGHSGNSAFVFIVIVTSCIMKNYSGICLIVFKI